MSTDRHVTALAIIPKSVDEVRSLSAIYAKSSLLPPDLRGKEADVFVTVMAGLELGLSPMATAPAMAKAPGVFEEKKR